MNTFGYLLLSILFNTSSHLFLKKGVVEAKQKNESRQGSTIIGYITQWAIWTGLFFNGMAALFWLIALSAIDLSYAFPFLSLNYILIPIGAMLLYREHLSRTRIIGILVICVGIFFIAIS
ncbi:MAG: EamA family transporter [Saprospiraceae bacterium]|nr:EamA family transporter [Saprospiraceae bacterium]